MRWLAAGEHEIDSGLGWLTVAEAARLNGLRFTKRRTEYLLRRWTAKRAVATDRGIGDPHDARTLGRVEVGNHPSGAPFVLLDGEPLDADISVTDRAGWAVCLVGTEGERAQAVGVDLEVAEPRSDTFVDDYLTAAEADDVRSRGPRTEQDAAANLYWSAKEAALKVRRTGLRADTRTVVVALDRAVDAAGWGRLAVRHTPSGGLFPGWWRRDGVFLLTMAVDGPLPAPAAVLAGSADLADAVPVHSWMDSPTAW